MAKVNGKKRVAKPGPSGSRMVAEMRQLVEATAAGRTPPGRVIRTTPQEAAVRVAVGQLKSAREAAGLTLADVATATGVSAAELSRLELGQESPVMDTLARYARAVGRELRVSVEPIAG